MAKQKAPPGGHTVSMAPSKPQAKGRMQRTIIEHGAEKGTGTIRHEHRDTGGGYMYHEEPAHVFSSKKELMAHLSKVIGGSKADDAC